MAWGVSGTAGWSRPLGLSFLGPNKHQVITGPPRRAQPIAHAQRGRTPQKRRGSSGTPGGRGGGGLLPDRPADPTKEIERRAKFFQGSGAGGRNDTPNNTTSSSSSSSSYSSSSSSSALAAAQRGGGSNGALPGYMLKVDKTQISKDDSEEVARRLRAPVGGDGEGDGALAGRPIRLFRYAVDDLRLLKALDNAGLEGRVIVVDNTGDADIIIASQIKRTGKQIDLGPPRRAAAARGIPFVVLEAISGPRVVAALAPLLGPEAAAAADAAARAAAPPGGWAAGGRSGSGPRLITKAEAEADGGDQLMALLWATAAATRGSGSEAATPSSGLNNSISSSAAEGSLPSSSSSTVDPAAARLADRVARMDDPWALLAGADVEDDRSDVLPQNPTARADNKYPPLRRPMRRGSRIEKRAIQKVLGENVDAVDW